MDTRKVTEYENTTASQALALFHQGKWAQTLPILRQVHKDMESSVAISAALGICELFSTGPLEPEDNVTAWENLETVTNLFHQGESVAWPEIAFCQVWLQLLQEKKAAPNRIPGTLDVLANLCQQSQWFPIWALTFRVLAYYDCRQTMRDLLIQRDQSLANRSDGFKLVLIEAQLECGQLTSNVVSLLQNIDIQNCLPLSSEVAHLWQQWLLAEVNWWLENDLDSVEYIQKNIVNILKIPIPKDDPCSLNEWSRLKHRAALLGTRFALSQRNAKQAQQWLELAYQSKPESWENQYINGLIAWSQGDYQNAQTHLEQSLVKNPYQSRVYFERGLLLSRENINDNKLYLEDIPRVYDILASAAIILFRNGDEAKAWHRLEQLEQAEAPYSLRLIWPQARILRLRQGKQLYAHLVEAGQNWLEAIKRWDEARATDSSVQLKSPNQARNLTHRAHRLYLLGQHLRQEKADEEESNKTLYIQFQKELGRLSTRHLTGEAMFYRGLAAEQSMPERTKADWQALLRQIAWVEKTQKLAPERLLYLGDQLLQFGLHKDTQKAYSSASMTKTIGSQERLFAIKLITDSLSQPIHLLRTLEATHIFTPEEPFWLFLHGLYFLANEPPDRRLAQSLLEQAQQIGLPRLLNRLSELLPKLVMPEPDLSQELKSFLDSELGVNLPLVLRVGLETLSQPQGTQTLSRFKELFGSQWVVWCPIPPEKILGQQLRTYCMRSEYMLALNEIQEAEKIGLRVPAEWKAFLYTLQAIRTALSGDFESGKKFQKQASMSLLPDLHEVDEYENGI